MIGRLRIGVVGCGIAGTSFALLARQRGHDVDLFEQTHHIGPLGAGVLLQPSGQRILAAMGLLETVTARSEIVREIHAVTHRGKDLIRLDYADGSPGAAAFGVHRGDLFSVLHSALEAAEVHLHLGTVIESRELTSNQAMLRDEQHNTHGPFDLVVIADGARSRLRRLIGMPHTCHEYTYGALWAVGTCQAVRGRLFQTTRGTRRLCGLLPMGQNRCSFFWGLRRDEYQALCDPSDWDDWRKEVLALAPAAKEILDGLHPPNGLTFTTFWHVVMPKWTSGPVVFIGDAAHSTSPHLGQGVNLALIDAATLASAIQNNSDLSAALTHYVAKRRRQIRFYSRATQLMTPFFQSDGWIKGCGRDVALPWLQSIAPVRRLMLKALRGEAYS